MGRRGITKYTLLVKPDALRLFNTITAILDERKGFKREIEELKTQRDEYKKMYEKFKKAFIQGGRKLTGE